MAVVSPDLGWVETARAHCALCPLSDLLDQKEFTDPNGTATVRPLPRTGTDRLMHCSGVTWTHDELDHDAARKTQTDQNMYLTVWGMDGVRPRSRYGPWDSVRHYFVIETLLS